MTPERWQQIDNLFQVAVELDPITREHFLDSSCGHDEELRREVESLITSDEHGISFIDAPAFEAAATLLADTEPALAEGQNFGQYEIIRLLGRGGMGEVYLALDKKLKRKVALKLLPADFTTDKERLRRFQQEAQAASALNHPNILTIHELGEVNGQQFIATEFVDGETLRERLTHGPLSLSDALEISIEVASALAAAHQAGIIHRDIKPENIMLRPDGYVKVLDFGLAKLIRERDPDKKSIETESLEQSSGVVMGTIKYMSPEQARGDQVDRRSDLFSFGVVLYEMVTWRSPFTGKNANELISAILNDEPVLPAELNSELQLVIRRCLSKDRAGRYESAQALLNDLKVLRKEVEPEPEAERRFATAKAGHAASSLKGTATVSSVEYVAKQRSSRTPRILAAVALMLVAGTIGFGVYRFVKSRRAAIPFQNIAITKFTNFGDAWGPSISPDGKYVVYAKNNVGPVKHQAQFTLWKRAVGNANEVELLAPTPGRVYHTAFAPDGKRVYFGVGTSARIQLFMISIEGGTPSKVLDRAFPVGISPDSSSLAYLETVETEGRTSLIIANADGSSKREIIKRENSSYVQRSERPAWSPDGKRIACVGQERDKSFPHVFVVDLDTRTEKTITSQKWTEIRGLSWLPDMNGLLLVAAEETSSIPQIWHISYPDGAARRITNDTVNYSRLDLTVNGDTLVSTAGEILTSIWVMPVENGQPDSKMPLTVDISKARQISSLKLTSRDDLQNRHEILSWTHDGRIVYMSKESGNADIWSMNSEGGDRKQLTTDPHTDNESVVSPDGRFIAFVSNRSGAENIWIMDVDGGNQRRLTSDFVARSPEFSGDGQWVFFTSWKTGKPAMWKVFVDGGEPIEVVPTRAWYPTVAPDGKLLAYLGDQAGGTRFPQWTIVPSIGGPTVTKVELNFGPTWLPTGKGLSYTWQGPIEGQPDRQTFNIWEQLLTGEKPRQLTKFAEPISIHAWSRDGKSLAALTFKYTSDVVLISQVK